MNDRVWISGDQQTVIGLLDQRLDGRSRRRVPRRVRHQLSAAEVASAANRLANALVALGVRPGDRVATLVENSPEAMLAWWGIVRGGAVAVPINTAYKGEYLRHQLADSGSRVLIVEAVAGRPRRPHLGRTRRRSSHVVVIGGRRRAAGRRRPTRGTTCWAATTPSSA